MPMVPPLSGASFYDNLPTPDHRTGDIWRHLPTFSVLNRTTASGVIITPACDLASRKCETVTYLPIIPAADYLGSPAFRYECWQEILPLLQRLPDFGAVLPPSRFDLISISDLRHLAKPCTDMNGRPLSLAESHRLQAYQEYVTASTEGTASMSHLRGFFKEDRLTNLLSRLVTNSLKSDIHFLPKDEQPVPYAAIPTHSVVLFRYALSLPLAALHLAQETSESQWDGRRVGCAQALPVLLHMHSWPIKLAALRGEFLSDMISRYLNMYIRFGSTDFSIASIRSMADEIGE